MSILSKLMIDAIGEGCEILVVGRKSEDFDTVLKFIDDDHILKHCKQRSLRMSPRMIEFSMGNKIRFSTYDDNSLMLVTHGLQYDYIFTNVAQAVRDEALMACVLCPAGVFVVGAIR